MNAEKILLVLGVGAAAYWLYQRSQQPAARAPSAGITPTGVSSWQIPDLSLPAVQAWPVCPAGQYYDPNLQMCMVAPIT